jgi:hypothetical protein
LKPQRKAAPAPYLAPDSDTAAVPVNDFPANGETQPGPGGMGNVGRFAPKEAFK